MEPGDSTRASTTPRRTRVVEIVLAFAPLALLALWPIEKDLPANTLPFALCLLAPLGAWYALRCCRAAESDSLRILYAIFGFVWAMLCVSLLLMGVIKALT